MNQVIDRISILGSEFSKQWLEEHYETQGHGILNTVYQNSEARAVCLCRPESPQPLSVRRLSDEGIEHYVLARMPRSWRAHDPDCVFRTNPDATGLAAIESGPLRRNTDGHLDLAVDIQLTASSSKKNAAKKDQKPSEADAPGKARVKRSAISLKGLLYWLWSAANLDVYRPKIARRTYSYVQMRVSDLFEQAMIKSRSMSSIAFMPSAFQPEIYEAHKAAWETWRKMAIRHEQKSLSTAGIVIGEIKQITQWGASGRVFALRFKHLPYVSFALYSDMHEALTRDYAFELSILNGESESARVLCAAVVGCNEKEFLFVNELVLVATDRNYIPVDNCAEQALIERLTITKRVFKKHLPIMGTRIISEPLITLLDGEIETPMEIFHESGEMLEILLEDKVSYFDSRKIPFWYWIVDKELPDFPPKHGLPHREGHV